MNMVANGCYSMFVSFPKYIERKICLCLKHSSLHIYLDILINKGSKQSNLVNEEPGGEEETDAKQHQGEVRKHSWK